MVSATAFSFKNQNYNCKARACILGLLALIAAMIIYAPAPLQARSAGSGSSYSDADRSGAPNSYNRNYNRSAPNNRNAPNYRAHKKHRAGKFDYYTLALSWSPTYCAGRRNSSRELQCNSARPYAFVLHGVWPQYKSGWPQYCRVRNNWVSKQIIQSMLDIMPSKKLIIHEWKKHGTCSGYEPKGYYDLSRKLFNSIKIPPQYTSTARHITTTPAKIEQAFLDANPALKKNMISVVCGGKRRLREIRICFNRNNQLAPCGQNEAQRKLCRSNQIVLPPVRVSR